MVLRRRLEAKVEKSSESERSEYFFGDRIRIRIYLESSFWPEYEYEYIRDLTIDRIRIQIYSLFYCGPNTNIRIFKYEYAYSNIRIFQYIIWPKSTKNWSNLTQDSVFPVYACPEK